MKFSHAFATVLSVSALAIFPTIASADPVSYDVEVMCPTAVGEASSSLGRFADYVAGYGFEFLPDGNELQVYFKSDAYLDGIPASLGNYYNDSVSYDSTTGNVSCNFVSSDYSENPFSVNYHLTNATGGTATVMGSDDIIVSVPFGLKHH